MTSNTATRAGLRRTICSLTRFASYGGRAAIIGASLVMSSNIVAAQSIRALSIGGPGDLTPAFGKATNANDASAAFGQTFRPTSAVCPISCALQSFTFWLGNDPQLNIVNAPDLRFRAYLALWDGTRPTSILYASDIIYSGPTALSQRYDFAVPNIGVTVGTRYVAFLSAVGLFGNILPATASAGMEIDFSNPASYVDGAWVYTSFGATLAALTSSAWDLTDRDPLGQARFAAVFGEASTVVPEPSTYLMVGAGLMGIVMVRRRQQRAASV